MLSGLAQVQQGYHSDDTYLIHHDKTGYDACNVPRDLHISCDYQ